MKKLIHLSLVGILLLAAACGGRTMGINANNSNDNSNDNGNANVNVNTNDNGNANTNVNTNVNPYVTRGVVYQQLTEFPMGFSLDSPVCQGSSQFPDVTVPSFLACALNSLGGLGHDPHPFQNEEFFPQESPARAEIWMRKVEFIGFVPYMNCDVPPDLSNGEWYVQYYCSLAVKGLVRNQNGYGNAGNGETGQDWENSFADLMTYLSQAPTRSTIAEAVVALLGPYSVGAQYECRSQYEDVADNSLDCYTTNILRDLGALDFAAEHFRRDDPMTWAEIIKVVWWVLNPDTPILVCSGCAGIPGHWGACYADTFCDQGLLPESFRADQFPSSLREVNRFLYQVQMHLNQ